jgi:hypothetical protein
VERAEAIPEGSRVQEDSKSAGSGVCSECGRDSDDLTGDGICQTCYHRHWRARRREDPEYRTTWNSKKYPDGCSVCGTKDRKHHSLGMCVGCYNRKYKSDNWGRMLELGRSFYHRNKIRISEKNRSRYRDDPLYRLTIRRIAFRSKYDGNGIVVLERSGYACEICGYSKMSSVLEIHHKDWDRSNNDLGNLQVCCPTCHKEQHYGS